MRCKGDSFDMVVSTGSFGSWKNPVKVLKGDEIDIAREMLLDGKGVLLRWR